MALRKSLDSVFDPIRLAQSGRRAGGLCALEPLAPGGSGSGPGRRVRGAGNESVPVTRWGRVPRARLACRWRRCPGRSDLDGEARAHGGAGSQVNGGRKPGAAGLRGLRRGSADRVRLARGMFAQAAQGPGERCQRAYGAV